MIKEFDTQLERTRLCKALGYFCYIEGRKDEEMTYEERHLSYIYYAAKKFCRGLPHLEPDKTDE